MTEREQAADHLKVIRSLMERATVYRTISWPTALGGGTLATILSAVLFLREQADVVNGTVEEKGIAPGAWIMCWIVALILTAVFNGFLISRKSRAENRPFFSPGLKMALRAFVPPMLAGGIIGIALTLSVTPAIGASLWVIFYGLALLATRGLAPVSIPRLGWLLLVSGLVAFLYSWSDGAHPLPVLGVPQHMESPMLEANLIMGTCFGLVHLVYGVIVMRNSRREEESTGIEGD